VDNQESRFAGQQLEFRRNRQVHWDAVARRLDQWRGFGGYYHRRIAEVFQEIIPAGLRVLEIGCGEGDLLASLQPSLGVGADISVGMLRRSKQQHPHLHFIQSDGHSLGLGEKFDVIVLSDLLNEIWDVQGLCEQIQNVSGPATRIIINSYSQLWQLPLAAAAALKLAKPQPPQNWLTVEDITNMLQLAGFEVVRSWPEILFPIYLPLITPFANRMLVRLPFLKYFALCNVIVARTEPQGVALKSKMPRVSVVVPARNEAGNIAEIFARTPEMGSGTELVFVEGHSSDNTYAAIESAIRSHPERLCQLMKQPGVGKGDAVRCGFDHASGDIFMILDADLTVPPEELPRFYEAITSGRGEFINGVRLVYPMEEKAMRFANLVGNKFFSLAFTWLLGQPIKDTLCGTKVLARADYARIAANRAHFGDFDPFGDFDLLFGAARQNLKFAEIPIRYRQRTYGDTNIQRWQHGWLLLKMVFFAAWKIKFR